MKNRNIARLLCALLALCMLTGSLVACSGGDEIPEGYQYATCKGEYFRLFVPTQWKVNTESGVSGAYYSLAEGSAVSMAEVHFEKPATDGEGEDVTATLADFFAAHTADISQMKGYQAEKDFDSTLGSYKDKDLTYTATTIGETFRFRQVLTKVEGRFYLFTYSAKADYFDRWLDTVDGILENIMFYAYPFEGSEDEVKIPNVDSIPDGMKLVTGNDVAYRFFAPADWVVGEADAAALVYFSEEDRSNVTVMGYVPEAETYSVANYWEDTEKYYKDALNDYTITAEPVEETMGGKRATVYEYTYTLGGVTYKCRQVVCVYSYMIVVMTYTALPENYDAHLSEVEQMQGALTFRR
ncbi:MAG: hypothetical protein IJX72_04905 [Clostridia bacterium]|nr:hypothetical protein [Clostridia bacterium]